MTHNQNLMVFAKDTVTDPRQAARRLIETGLPDSVRVMGFVLVVVLTTLLGHFAALTLPPEVVGGDMPAPLETAALQAGLMLGVGVFIHLVGRWAGGKGLFRDAILLLVWMQFILILLQAAQIVAQILVPPFAVIMAIGSIVVMFYLLSNFVAELHGFRSAWMTFAGIFGVMIVASFILAALFGPYILALAA